MILFVGLGAMSFSSSARATMYCAATVGGGSDANDDGLSAGITDLVSGAEGSVIDIRLRAGTFQLGSIIINFAKDKDNKTFKLSGGWDSTCQNRTGKASDSVIKGAAASGNSPGTDFLLYGDNARYDFQNLRFEDFGNISVSDKACTFQGGQFYCPDTDAIVVDHVEFYNGGAVDITAYDAKKVVFRNNLVAKLTASNGSPPVSFDIRNDEDAPDISFNTFANVTCAGSPGVSIRSSQAHVALHHNIVQTTGCSDDLYIDPSDGGKTVTPYYNLLLSTGGLVGGNLVGNGNVLNFNPQFVDAFNGNYRLQENASPAINKGATLVGAIQSGLVVPSRDLDGKTRPIGTRFDIGAYESNKIDGVVPVITVNSADDDDDGLCDAAHCSLREAINLANSQANSAQRIKFDIDGSCPRVILLDSPLPDITDSVWINGATQPGSALNTQDLGSDAQVCLLIGPGATMSHAIAVPASANASVNLTLDGFGFANSFFYAFTTAAVELRAGSGHKISGNVFGGYMPPGNNTQQIGALSRAIYMAGTAKDVVIGGADDADRNYFGSLGENGIVMNSAGNSHVTIQNNYIGVQPNGQGAQANNADGISISGGVDGTIVDNAICASDAGISLIGSDVTGFTIQRNNIGVNAAGYGVAAHANNDGIVVGLGSNSHIIGAGPVANLQPGSYSNFIDNNNFDGIDISSTASAGNVSSAVSIRGNLIEGNGRSGAGIGIDLGGTKAPLANDGDDTDDGANGLQNHPVLKGTRANGALALDVRSLFQTAANVQATVDFYFSASCNPTTGAGAAMLLGSKDVITDANGRVDVSATVSKPAQGGYLTAVATTLFGNTSELSACMRTDTIFVDGHD